MLNTDAAYSYAGLDVVRSVYLSQKMAAEPIKMQFQSDDSRGSCYHVLDGS